jgi:hypothetical protein
MIKVGKANTKHFYYYMDAEYVNSTKEEWVDAETACP